MHQKMNEINMNAEKIANIKKTLTSWLCNEVDKGPSGFDVEQAGEVTDMIKDLSEAEEKCMKKMYYELICYAMLDADGEEDRQGYDNWRYSSGKFAPTGHGHRTGYTPYIHEPMMEGKHRMGYPNSGMNDSSHMGMRNDNVHAMDSRSGYTDGPMEEDVIMTLDTMREMWRAASPDLRKRMKSNVGKLMDEMNI